MDTGNLTVAMLLSVYRLKTKKWFSFHFMAMKNHSLQQDLQGNSSREIVTYNV